MNAKGSKAPFVRISVPFLIGAWCGANFPGFDSGIPLLLAVLTSWILVFWEKSKLGSNRIRTPWLFLCLILLGFHSQSEPDSVPNMDQRILIGVVRDQVRTKNRFSEYNIEWSGCCSYYANEIPFLTRTLIYGGSSALKKGEIIEGYPVFSLPSGPYFEGGFDERKYLRSKGIRIKAVLNRDGWTLIRKMPDHEPDLVETARNSVAHIGKKYLPDSTHLGLFTALVSGDRSGVPKSVADNLASVGVVHVLAVSGMHVGLVYGMVFGLISLVFSQKMKVRWGIPITLVAIVFYTLFTGASSSVVRASAMLSIFLIGKWLGRKSSGLNIVFLCLFAMLIYDPTLWYQPGFRLSFFAVISILLIYPRLKAIFYPPYVILRRILDVIYISIAAQLGTSVLSVSYFHQFPNYFLLSNLIVAPLLIMVLYGCILLIVLSPLQGAADWLSGIISRGMSYSLSIAERISALPHSMVKGLYMTDTEFWLLYAFLSAIVFWLLFRMRLLWILSVIIAVSLVAILFSNYSRNPQLGQVKTFNGRDKIITFCQGHQGLIILQRPPDQYPAWQWKNIKTYMDVNRVQTIDTITIPEGNSHKNVTNWSVDVLSSNCQNVSFTFSANFHSGNPALKPDQSDSE